MGDDAWFSTLNLCVFCFCKYVFKALGAPGIMQGCKNHWCFLIHVSVPCEADIRGGWVGLGDGPEVLCECCGGVFCASQCASICAFLGRAV